MRKRSKYKPRPMLANPVQWVLGGFQPMRENEHITSLRIKNHAALLDMAQGRGSRDSIDILIACMNVAEALYRVNPDLGLQYCVEIRAAQDAIVAMSRRGIEKGKFLFTGPELQAMNTGMEVHDAQLDACVIAELEKALDLVAREIRYKKVRVIA
jgi:hypothetical protein